MACDDQCYLKMGASPNTVDAPTELIKITSGTGFRQFYKFDTVNRKSDWITMTKGEPYYIEAGHVEWTHGDHFSVAVEIEQTGTVIADHHHTKREIQYLSIDPKNDFDTLKVTVENPDDKEYVLIF